MNYSSGGLVWMFHSGPETELGGKDYFVETYSDYPENR